MASIETQLAEIKAQIQAQAVPISRLDNEAVSVAIRVILAFWLAQLQRHINPPLNRTSCTLGISIYINFTLTFEA
jgi:hypothetical protein